MIAEAWLRQGGDWTRMPANVLYTLANWTRQAPPDLRNPHRHTLHEAHYLALNSIDRYLLANNAGQGIIKRYGGDRTSDITRKPFRQAQIERHYDAITIASVNSALVNSAFHQVLYAILEYADYVYEKEQNGTAAIFSPVSPVPLDRNWQQAIKAALSGQSQTQTKQSINQSTPGTVQPTKAAPLPVAPPSPAYPRTFNATPEPVLDKSIKPGQPLAPREKPARSERSESRPVPPAGHSLIELDQARVARLQKESEQLQERLTVEATSPSLPAIQVPTQPSARPFSATTRETLHTPARLDQETISQLREGTAHLQERLTVEQERKQKLPETWETVNIRAEQARTLPVSAAPSAKQEEPEVDEDWQIIYPQWQAEHWEILHLLCQGQTTQFADHKRQNRRPISLLVDEINIPVDEQLNDLLIDPETQMLAPHWRTTAEHLVRWYYSLESR